MNNQPLFSNLRLRSRLNQCLHIKRFLKGKGKIKVSLNQEVSPNDVIAVYEISGGFTSINLARELNLSPQIADKNLTRKIGSTFFRGELLASKKSLFGQNFLTAPTDGVLENYNPKTGELRIKFLPKEVELTAGVFGVIDQLDPEKGEILIRTMVTEIFGVLGTGSEKSGHLSVIAGNGDLVNASRITESHREKIVVAGALVLGEALRKAFSLGLKGLISGGINLSDYSALAGSIYGEKKIDTEIGFSVLVTEGFGLIPLGMDIYKIARENEGNFVFLNGDRSTLILPSPDPNSILSIRKIRLPIPTFAKTVLEKEVAELKVGSKVRVVWPPFMGAQGEVLAIDQTPTRLESGIFTFMVTLELQNQKLKVPYTNVEIIQDF